VKGQDLSTSLVTVLNTISPISESFRRLENNIIYSNPDRELNTLMITSSTKGEGKTTTITNLGVVLAEAGYNVALVDTDLRRPNLHNMFGMSRSPGMVEILFEDVSIEEVVQPTIIPNLSMITAGTRPPNPASITQSQAFLDILKELEEIYDFVLVDTPPMGIITDASPIVRQADGVVVVARFNEAREAQLEHTIEHLNRLNAYILGTVLTAFDYSKTSDYNYGNYEYREMYEGYAEYHE
jgi:capsular exopolysaccharide synthesis family protein